MRIEILLKDIRERKRIKFRTISKNNRNIKITLKLHRKKRKDAYINCVCNDSTGIKYKSRRIIQSNTVALI